MVKFRIKDNLVYKLESDRPPVTIGTLQGGFYLCKRNLKEHLHFMHDGWGIDVGLAQSLMTGKAEMNVEMEKGTVADKIQIHDELFGDTYYSDMATMLEFGIREEYGEHGEQVILPRIYWAFNVNDYERASEGFVHLHVHSDYSLLDGMGKIEEYVYTAKRMGMKSLALTDHGTVMGLNKFHRVCNQAGIKPLLGSELYIVDDMMVKKEEKRGHILVIAKNYTGYKNLIRLSTLSFLDGFYYRPRVDKKTILEHKEGLIIMSACLGGRVLQRISEGKVDEARDEIRWWKAHFGEDYYVELVADSLDGYIKGNPILVKLAMEEGVKIVATKDVHYTNQTDSICQDVLLGIQKRKALGEKPGFESKHYWFASASEMDVMFEEYQAALGFEIVEEAIKNTLEVAEKVEKYELSTGLILPNPIRTTSLGKMCFDELERRSLYNSEYVDRLRRELDVISEMELENYFVMLKEIVDWAKSKGIRVGAGRGSVAGSLTAYVLGITQVDPIRWGLLFERFLNVGRKVSPDIDIDLDSRRRDEVIDFVSSRYITARISTAVRLNGKGIVRDGMKVCGLAPWTVELISKNIPFGLSIDEAYIESEQFSKLFDDHKEKMMIIRRLEGVIKTTGLHPAGIIVADQSIGQYFGLKRTEGQKGEVVIQGDMEDVDYVGLIKVDLLGSKTQTILDMCVKATGIELDTIGLAEKDVFEEFSKGNCEDIFQFNSDLARDTLKKVKPVNFEELAAVTALIRPGAGDFIKTFANKSYKPVIKDMERVLADTRNVILYQEQSMLIAQEIAGFSLEKADDLRKAIGKKIPKLMASLRKDFVDGGVAKGYPRERIVEVFNIIEKSQGYAFNKSHAVAYTLSSYWSMWFKVRYPIVYAVAEMTVEGEGDSDKLKKYISVAKAGKIKMYPPDINVSDWGFTAEEDGVRCGLSMVKRFSDKSYEHVRKGRPFKTFAEFMEYAEDNKRLINKGAIQCLIGAGAFDRFGTRKALSETVDDWKALIKRFKGKEIVLALSDKEWNSVEKGKFEFDSLGFYLTVDPLKSFEKELVKYKLTPWTEFRDALPEDRVRVAGVVMNITPYKSKKGQMAFVDITGSEKEYVINVWAEAWEKYKDKFNTGDVIVCGGEKLEGNRVSVGMKGNIKRLEVA